MGGRGASSGRAGRGGTMSTNKSDEQIQREYEQLRDMPSGSQIQYYDPYTGKMLTLTAHDPRRIAPNGRFVRSRKYSEIVPSAITGVKTQNTMDPYYIAQGQWRPL